MFDSIELGALLIQSENKLKMSRPENNTNPNSVFDPLPSPHLAWKITLNTNVKTASMHSGLKNDQSIPSADPLYRAETSRLVNSCTSALFRQKLANISIGDADILCIFQEVLSGLALRFMRFRVERAAVMGSYDQLLGW